MATTARHDTDGTAVLQALLSARSKPPAAAVEADKHERTTGGTLGIFELSYIGQVALRHMRAPVAMTTSENATMSRQLTGASKTRMITEAKV